MRDELKTGSRNPSPVARYALLLFKLSVSACLIYLLVSKIGGRTIVKNIRLLDPVSFIGAIVIYWLTAFTAAMRWGLLIPGRISKKRLYSLFMIGSFFNAYMPGIVGGDAVKAYYLSRESGTSLGTAIASVFMDRYTGFSALLTIGMAALFLGPEYLEAASAKMPLALPLKWFVPALVIAYILSGVVIFKFRLGRKVGFLSGIYEYFGLYGSRKKILLKAFLYSICVQLGGIIAVFVLSRGLSLHVSFLAVAVFLPIVIIITTIPVSISGIGLREGAFVFLFGAVGISPQMAVTLSLSWFLSVVSAGLLGLIMYLRYKRMFGGEEK